MESLEKRVLLDTAPFAPGGWTQVDTTAAQLVNLIGLGSATTAGVTATVLTTNDGLSAGNDRVDGINIDTTGAAAGNIAVDLVMTGEITGPINFTTLASQNLTVRIIKDSYTDIAGGTVDPQGQGDAAGINFVAANLVANPDTANTMADGSTLLANGSVGAINFDANAVIKGGRIDMQTNNVGPITINGNVDLSSNLVVQTADANAGSVLGFTVVGSTTLNNFSMDLSMAEFGAAAGPVSLSANSTVNLNGTGSLTIDSTNVLNNGSTLGPVTLGDVIMDNAGDIAISTGANSNIVGAVNVKSVTISGALGATFSIAPSGTGDFGAGVTFGAISIDGANAANAVNIGSATSTYLGGLTLGGLLSAGDAAGSGLFIAGNGISGTLNLGTHDYRIADQGDFNITMVTADAGTGAVGSINTGNLIVEANANQSIDISFAGGAGSVTFNNLVNYGGAGRNINITFDSDASGDNVSSFTSSSIYIGDEGNERDPLARPAAALDNDGNISILFLGGVGNVTTGPITIGDAGETDAGDVVISTVSTGANNRSMGSFNASSVYARGNSGTNLTVDVDGSGSIGGITLGEVVIANGNNNITFGHIAGPANTPPAANDLGNLGLADVTISSGGNLTFQARDIDDVNITGSWGFSGTGDVNITADAGANAPMAERDGVLGNIGGNAWDVVFGTGAHTSASINVKAADGMGSFTVNRVDHVNAAPNWTGSAPRGGFDIRLDNDNDTFGPFTTLTVRTAGADDTDNIVWGDNSVLSAEQGTSIILAGGASGQFLITAGDDNDDSLGTFIVGQDSNGAPVDDSDFTGVLSVDDGFGSFLVRGANSQVGAQTDHTNPALPTTIRAATINANADGAAEDSTLAAIAAVPNINPNGSAFQPVGNMPDLTIEGIHGAMSLVATLTARDFGAITLNHGGYSANVTTNVATVLDQNTIESNVTRLEIKDGGAYRAGGPIVPANILNPGALLGNNFTLDDGFAEGIKVADQAPVFGDAMFGAIILDADGANAGGARSGGMPAGIVVSGALNILTLDSDAVNQAVTAAVNVAANTVSTLQSGQSMTIGTLDIGGSLPTMLIVNATGTANDGDPTPDITVTGSFQVNGNVDRIATNGATNENISLPGGSWIAGDLDVIDAGDGKVTIPAPGLQILRGVQSSPFWVVTSLGVDFFIDISGPDAASAVLNATVVFPAVPTDAADNSVTINDIDGLVNVGWSDTTRMAVATRLHSANPSSATADDTGVEFDLTGFFDPDNDRSDFYDFRVEGDLRGDIGSDINAFDGIPDAAPLGIFQDLKILGTWVNREAALGLAGSNIFVMGIGDLAVGSLANDATPISTPGVNQFSSDTSVGQFGDAVIPGGQNANGTQEALEVFGTLLLTNEQDIVVSIPDGGSITKNWIGPTGQFESITFTDEDADGIINTVVFDINNGILGDIHLFGENFGIEFNTLDPQTPASNSTTNIYYVVAQAGIQPTETSAAGQRAIEYIEFSSGIGNVTTVDINTGNDADAGVGQIRVGYLVNVNNAPDSAAPINHPGDGSAGGPTVATKNGVIYLFGMGNVSVDGPIGTYAFTAPGTRTATGGGIFASGNVGNVTTHDTTVTDMSGTGAADGVPDAFLYTLVLDGSVNAINIAGDVVRSLVVGDRVLTSLGGNAVIGGGDDVVGINGTPVFMSDINVAGSVGSTPADVRSGDSDGNLNTPDGLGLQDQISAPDGIGVNITVGEVLNAAVVSGKRILVDPTENQEDDDLSGNIQASEIFGDIWSGDDISGAFIKATGLGQINAPNGVPNALSGDISSSGCNTVLDIFATGGTPGNITADILAAGDLNNVYIDAGSGTGGYIQADIIAGTDGSGGVTGTSKLEADDNIGVTGNVVSSADGQTWASVVAGAQTSVDPLSPQNTLDGGHINSDFLAGVPIGATAPLSTNVNSSNLPIFQAAAGDSIVITLMQAGWAHDGADGDTDAHNDMDSNLNGTLAAANSVTITTLQIDGNVIGNDGVPGGHVIAAGLGAAGNATITGGTIVAGLLGTIDAGMFVPFDDAGPSPLWANDLGPLQAGTVLTQGSVTIGAAGQGNALSVGQWEQSATGAHDPAGTPNGITMRELLDGSESGTTPSYVPVFSLGATLGITAYMNVIGLPWSPPQTGIGTVNPDPATGDITFATVVAFNGLSGHILAEDSAYYNLVMSDIDAVTAIDTAAGDPSDPSTTPALNSSVAGNNNLNLTANGHQAGGLWVEFDLAGFDYFTRIDTGGVVPSSTNRPVHSLATAPKTPDFWASFGYGSIGGNLISNDSDPTNGLEVGDIEFYLIAAGQRISGDIIADDDIIGHKYSNDTDGTLLQNNNGQSPAQQPLVLNGKDGDIMAGMIVNLSISPHALADLFRCGFIGKADANGIATGEPVNIVAGDDIYSVDLTTGAPASGTTYTFTQTGSWGPTFLTDDDSTPLVVENQEFNTWLMFDPTNPQADGIGFVTPPAGSTVTLLSVTWTASARVGNAAQPAGSGNATLTNNGAVTMPNPTVLGSRTVTVNSPAVNLNGFVVLTNDAPTVVFGPVDPGVTVGPLDFIPSSNTQTTSLGVAGANFPLYTGSGTFQTNSVKTATSSFGGTGGNPNFILQVNPWAYAADLTLVYTFQVVEPSPPSLAIEPYLVIAAAGDDRNDTSCGNIWMNLVSGAEDQLAGPDLFNGFAGFKSPEYEMDDDNNDGIPDNEDTNIWAYVVASGSIYGTIDAGDTQRAFGGVTNGGLGGASGLSGGNFYGGIHAGAGPDLNLFTTNDNDVLGSINATIRTINDLNVEDQPRTEVRDPVTGDLVATIEPATFGILAEHNINTIEVGFCTVGGDLLGNVVAENVITEIEVWGNVGRANFDSVIYAGGLVQYLGVGDASGIVDEGFNDTHPDQVYIDTFGTFYADLYMGGQIELCPQGQVDAFTVTLQPMTPRIYLGAGMAEDSLMLLGVNAGFQNVVLQQFGYKASYAGGCDTRMVFMLRGNDLTNSPDVYLYDVNLGGSTGDPGVPVSLTVFGEGAEASINRLVAVDGLDQLHIIDGSVNQIIVTDDYDVSADLAAARLDLVNPTQQSANGTWNLTSLWLDQFGFLINSLLSVTEIEHAVNNDKVEINVNVINVDGNIGTDDTFGVCNGLTGLNYAADNVAVYIQGNLLGSITSELGSVGNIVIGGMLADDTSIEAQKDLGDVYMVDGDINLGNRFRAIEGSIGVISAPLNVVVQSSPNLAGGNLFAYQNLGGIISRTKSVTVPGGEEVAVHGSIGLVEASGEIRGTFIAETGSVGLDLCANDMFTVIGGAGIYSDVGDISVTLVAGTDVGNVKAALGDLECVAVFAGGNVGVLTAGNDVYDLYLQVAGDVAGVYAGDDILAEEDEVSSWDVEGTIGYIRAGSSISGLSVEAGNIGAVTALSGVIEESVDLLAHGNIGAVSASGDILATLTAETGSIASITSDVGDINVVATAGLDIGPVRAVAGSILGTSDSQDFATGTIVLGVSGRLTAGRDIGLLSAGVGIGNYVITAGGNIAGLQTTTGAVGAGTEEIVQVFQYFGGLYNTTPILKTELREIGLLSVTAGGDIGAITSGAAVDGQFVAGGSIGAVTARTSLGARMISVDQPTTLTAGVSVGNLTASTGQIGAIIVHAVDSIGAITASLNVNGTYVAETGDIGAILSRAANVNVSATAGDEIGTITAVLGNVSGTYVARNLIGDVEAGMDIYGSYTSTEGSVGDLVSHAGNIGSASSRVQVKANGGVEIDPYTLEYVVVAPSLRGGVGVVYAEIGNIYVDITSGGNVGFADDRLGQSADHIVGGIAAPIGTVDAGLRVGGYVGGLSGQAVVTHGVGGGQAIIVGGIGILRNATGSGTVQGINVDNPLILISDNVEYVLSITSGTAVVAYSVDGGSVNYTLINWASVAGGDLAIVTRETRAGKADVSDQVYVSELKVSGNANLINIEGSLGDGVVEGNLGALNTEGDVENLVVRGDMASANIKGELGDLTVRGNLAGGTIEVANRIDDIRVEGNLVNETIIAAQGLAAKGVKVTNLCDGVFAIDSIHVVGNIGLAYGTVDPFKPNDVNIVAESFGSITASGTNYGSIHVTLDDSQWISWADQRSGKGDYLTAFIQKGSADLTINFGFLEQVAFTDDRSATNFVFLADASALDNPNDTSVTSKAGNASTYNLLVKQNTLVKQGKAKTGSYNNLVTEYGSTSIPGSDLAHIGTILIPTADADKTNVGLRVNALTVEGSVRSIGTLGVQARSLTDAYVIGDLGELAVTQYIKNMRVDGNVCTILADTIKSLTVAGNVDQIDTQKANDVVIQGSIGHISVANDLTNSFFGKGGGVIAAGDNITRTTIGGGLVTLYAQKLLDVDVSGGIGLVVDQYGTPVFNPTPLNQCQLERALGLSRAGSLTDIGDQEGPQDGGVIGDTLDPNVPGNVYIGGLEADTAVKVSVSGQIVDVFIHDRATNLGLSAFVNVIDDAFIRFSKSYVVVMKDGELINWDGTDNLNGNINNGGLLN